MELLICEVRHAGRCTEDAGNCLSQVFLLLCIVRQSGANAGISKCISIR